MTRLTACIGTIALLSALGAISSCGGGSGGGSRTSGEPATPAITPPPPPPTAPPASPPEVPIELSPITVFGIDKQQGHFDPAPTADADGNVWMSYSHVSEAASGKRLIETRLATTVDAGLNWQDAGFIVNEATALPLPPPYQINAIAHEVSRLIYNPYAEAAGVDPWLLLWHRYPGVLLGENKNFQLWQSGWLAMKSGATPASLGGERKLFTGASYDTSNNDDTFGSPEYPLNALFASELRECLLFTEPGILAKPEGVYVSLFCPRADLPGSVILLRCDHGVTSCDYLGSLIDGVDAQSIDSNYSDFSAPELVSVGDQDFLIVSPVSIADDLYLGCMAYRITDLPRAEIERNNGLPVAQISIEQRGDYNGACGYIEQLTGSGIIVGEAFFQALLSFELFATGAQL